MAGWNPHTSIRESEMVLASFIEEKKTFALELKENHKVIGSLGLEELSISPGNFYDNSVGREIGYVLSKEYWGRGLMPEAVKSAGFGFGKRMSGGRLMERNVFRCIMDWII